MKPVGYSSNGLKRWFFLAAFLFVLKANAQELFINTEPASSIPKGVLGVRVFGESWNEQGYTSSVERNMAALRLMYGLTSKLSVYATGTVSNHHQDEFPNNLLTHTHVASNPQNLSLGIPYPYQFNGIDIYAKYRFLSIDAQNKHFRMAAYGEWSDVNVPHDEAEPHLLDDNKGVGAGLISTFLDKHFAASITTGYIISGTYSDTQYLQTYMLNATPANVSLTYGNAYVYDLSLGYLLLPTQYKSYSQTNLSVYVEFMGESSDNAKVIQEGKEIVSTPTFTLTPLLLSNNYVNVFPGLQAILNSNLRVDLSVGFPLINRSYTVFYPIYMIGIQRYFFL